MLQREPSGLKNAQIESILEEYRVKLDDSLTDDNRDAFRLRAPAEAP